MIHSERKEEQFREKGQITKKIWINNLEADDTYLSPMMEKQRKERKWKLGDRDKKYNNSITR